ncbi:MAG TPA: PQQ-dependent sugar dehydrogenase [Xanthomonadales bacterium]|nr:PQQ-dependent sugar dehydrogenase [Xanthomonadales bacterium]
MIQKILIAVVLSFVFLTALGQEADKRGWEVTPPKPYQGKLNSLALLNIRNAELDTVIEGLQSPWAMEFVNPDELLMTEFAGRLLRVNLKTGEKTVISGVPVVANDRQQTGLLDVELHPDFENNQRLYLSYSQADPDSGKYYLTAVATALLKDDALEELEVIVEAGPHGWSPSNFGGALEFDNSGHLYVSIGDRSEVGFVQDPARFEGKILRMNDDGSAPADNPFADVAATRGLVYALGVRNPQGLYFDWVSGRLFESEHGPKGGDEVNVIEAGANYGWPDVSYGLNYTWQPFPHGTHKEGTQQPLYHYLPSRGISSIEMYRGDMFPEWDGDLLVAALRGHNLSRLDLDGDVVRSETPFLNEVNRRIRDLKVAEDGSIYILAEQEPDNPTGGVLLRLHRSAAEPIVEAPTAGKDVYEMVCAGCHDVGAADAPRLGVQEDWLEILRQPRSLTLERTLEGYQGMPARGLCYICNDQHLESALDYMLEQSSEKPAN